LKVSVCVYDMVQPIDENVMFHHPHHEKIVL